MEKITVERLTIGVSAYGPGAAVSATFRCYSPEDAERIAKALRALVDVQPGRWPEGIDAPQEE